MNKKICAVVLLGMALSSSSSWAAPAVPAVSGAASDGGGYDAKGACERYAQEDQIKPAQMADYMSQCLRDLGNDQAPEQDMDPSSFEQPVEGVKDVVVPVKPKDVVVPVKPKDVVVPVKPKKP